MKKSIIKRRKRVVAPVNGPAFSAAMQPQNTAIISTNGDTEMRDAGMGGAVAAASGQYQPPAVDFTNSFRRVKAPKTRPATSAPNGSLDTEIGGLSSTRKKLLGFFAESDPNIGKLICNPWCEYYTN